MAKPKADHRLSPINHVRGWIDEVAALCVPHHDPSDREAGKLRLFAASELSLHYPEATFTQASARTVSSTFTFARFPSVAELRKAIDAWRKETGAGPEMSRLLLSEARLSDPRVTALEYTDKAWIARWDARVVELRADGADPLWDSSDPSRRGQSKRANLASCIRRYSPLAWAVISRPYQASREIPEAEFLREWLNDRLPDERQSTPEEELL